MDSEWQTRADPSKCAVSRALNPLVPDRICRRHRKKSWQVSASSMPAIPMPSRSVHPSLRIVAGRRSPVRWAKDQFYGHACRRTAAFVVPTTNRCKWVGCDPQSGSAAIPTILQLQLRKGESLILLWQWLGGTHAALRGAATSPTSQWRQGTPISLPSWTGTAVLC